MRRDGLAAADTCPFPHISPGREREREEGRVKSDLFCSPKLSSPLSSASTSSGQSSGRFAMVLLSPPPHVISLVRRARRTNSISSSTFRRSSRRWHLLGTAQIHALLHSLAPTIPLRIPIRRGRSPIQRVDLLRDVTERLGRVDGAFVAAGDGVDWSL